MVIKQALLSVLCCAIGLPALAEPTTGTQAIHLSLKGDNCARHENLDIKSLKQLNASLDVYVVPDPIQPEAYSREKLPPWTYNDGLKHLSRLLGDGVPVIIGGGGGNEVYSYVQPEPIRLEDGTQVSRPLNIFDPAARQENFRQTRERIRQVEALGGPIEAHALTLTSNWGEIEYFVGFDIHQWERPLYGGYSQAEVNSFRDYLKHVYDGDLTRLNQAWGAAYRTWGEIQSPKPRREGEEPVFDGRPEWIDFNEWRTRALTDYACDLARNAREVTARPLDVMLGFSPAKGAVGASVGQLAKAWRQFAPVYFHCTDGLSLAAVRYMDSARRFYGIPTYLTENDGDRFMLACAQKLYMIGLLGGADRLDYCAVYNLGLHKQGYYRNYPNDVYYQMCEASQTCGQLDLQRPPTQIAFLNSTYSRFSRSPMYHNLDVANVYDDALSQMNAVASWGTTLGCPDVIDEQMILDGRLAGLKMLIVPNTSFTTIPDAALGRISEWVRGGGWLVAAGTGCFLNRLGEDHRVQFNSPAQPRAWAGGLLADVASAAAAAVDTARDTSASLERFQLADNAIQYLGLNRQDLPQVELLARQWITGAPGPDWIPLMANDRNQAAAFIRPCGKGGILFVTEPVPEAHQFGWKEVRNKHNLPFFHDLFPVLLTRLADRIGVDDGARASGGLRLAYVGLNRRDGRQTYVGFSLGSERGSTTIRFPAHHSAPGIHLLLFNQTIASAAWTDGTPAEFRQPSRERFWHDPTNTAHALKEPVMLPCADFDLAVPAGLKDQPAGAELRINW